MPATDMDVKSESLEAQLQEKSRELVSVLDRGDLPAAMQLINELQQAKHNAFYREVGYLTRGLHEAIKSFSSEIGVPEESEAQLSAMTDASERLDYVIQLTERAAHDTLDRVDRALELLDRVAVEEPAIGAVLGQVRSELTEILVGQGFQDITGQLIRRVIELLTRVETHLVRLMAMAAKVDQLGGLEASASTVAGETSDPERAEGPQLAGASAGKVAKNQDDVDELLSSLGF